MSNFMLTLNGRYEDIWTDVIMVTSVTNAQMAALKKSPNA
jgi:hypothetical protein